VADRPTIELLYWRECPSWGRALAMLREEMESAGLDPESIRAREVTTEEAASEEEFVGSPTIRIDGADMQPPGPDKPVGLNCRVYRHRDGRISPLPDRADLRDALKAATQGGIKTR
jgi:hypothetical protein